jgi:hypothetical protein
MSGFSALHDFYSPMPTFEGDNTVMLQQSSKYLFKMIKKHSKGKKLEEPFVYIGEIEETLANKTVCLGSTVDCFLNLKFLNKALKVKTSFIVKTISSAYLESKEPEKEKANDLFA